REGRERVREERGQEVVVDLDHRVLGVFALTEVAEAYGQGQVRVPLEQGSDEDGVARRLVAQDELGIAGGSARRLATRIHGLVLERAAGGARRRGGSGRGLGPGNPGEFGSRGGAPRALPPRPPDPPPPAAHRGPDTRGKPPP